MSEQCPCGKPVPTSSHSPWFCSEAHDLKWRAERYGEQAPTPMSVFPDAQLSVDGYGPTEWSELSWWPHPRDRWYRKQEAS